MQSAMIKGTSHYVHSPHFKLSLTPVPPEDLETAGHPSDFTRAWYIRQGRELAASRLTASIKRAGWEPALETTMSQVILTEKMMTAVWRRATLNGHPAAVANAKDNLNSFYCYVGALSSSGLDPRLRILDQLFDSLIKVALAARKAYFGAKYRVREPKLDDQNPVCISMRHLAKVQRLSDTQGTGVGTREGSEEEESEESGSAQKSSLEALAFVAAISLKLELQMNGAGPSSLPPTPYPTTPRYMVHANRFSKTEPQGTSPASSSAETPWSQKSWNSDHVSPLRLPVRDDDEDVFM